MTRVTTRPAAASAAPADSVARGMASAGRNHSSSCSTTSFNDAETEHATACGGRIARRD